MSAKREAATMKITLPWPASGLSPNARVHRMAKAKLARELRQVGYLVAAEYGNNDQLCGSDQLSMVLHLHPPDRRKRDLDNQFASLKPAIDGVFDYLGLDDSQVCAVTLHRCSPTKGGQVVLILSTAVGK